MSTFPQLSFVCPQPWANMAGDEKARFCTQCSRHIVNLSALTAEQRLALFKTTRPEDLCVAYYRRLSGEFVTAEKPLRDSESLKQFGLAVLSAGALALAAGCTAEKKQPPPITAKPVTAKPDAGKKEEVILLLGFHANPRRQLKKPINRPRSRPSLSGFRKIRARHRRHHWTLIPRQPTKPPPPDETKSAAGRKTVATVPRVAKGFVREVPPDTIDEFNMPNQPKSAAPSGAGRPAAPRSRQS